jgi:hypothetical protein
MSRWETYYCCADLILDIVPVIVENGGVHEVGHDERGRERQ